MSTTFHLLPIDPTVADQLRRAGGPTYVADSPNAFPCRQCLRDADPGEVLVLVSHDPFTVDSPYRGASPIFLHAEPCTPAFAPGELPHQLTSRRLSVRAFDDRAMMLDAAIIDGTDLRDTIERFFAQPDVDRLHVHNATRGCWAVSVTSPA